jgi:ABC-type lipoprotein release transport system permease subunit
VWDVKRRAEVEALLFGIGARDPITVAGVGVLLLGGSRVASLVPAYRATRVDPVVALRT